MGDRYFLNGSQLALLKAGGERIRKEVLVVIERKQYLGRIEEGEKKAVKIVEVK